MPLRPANRRTALVALFITTPLVMAACGGHADPLPELTKEKYDAIQPRMTVGQVSAIVGTEPTTVGAPTTTGTTTVQTYWWENGSQAITVTTTNNVVTTKRYTGPTFSYDASV